MTAILDAVAAATAGLARVYELGKVPTQPEYPYGVYSANLGAGAAYTLDSTSGPREGELVLQTFGRTDGSAGAHMDEITAVLLDVVLTGSGWDTTPLRQGLRPTTVRASEPENAGVIGKTSTLTFIWSPA